MLGGDCDSAMAHTRDSNFSRGLRQSAERAEGPSIAPKYFVWVAMGMEAHSGRFAAIQSLMLQTAWRPGLSATMQHFRSLTARPAMR
eukprot:1071620-Alexandrium_andersonii.AAC.1